MMLMGVGVILGLEILPMEVTQNLFFCFFYYQAGREGVGKVAKIFLNFS